MVTAVTKLIPPKAPNLPIGPVEYEQRYQDAFSNVLRLYFNQLDNVLQTLLGSNEGGGRFIRFPYGGFEDTAYTTLTVAVNSSATVLTVTSTTGFPTTGQIKVESEIITYTGITATTFTGCTRGARGTTAVSHTVGVYVTKIQAPGANTAAPMYFNTTDYSNDITLVSTTQMKAANAGLYNLQWSAQFNNTDTALQDVSVWLRVNGTDVVGSTGFVSIPSTHGGVDGHTIAGWNFFAQLNTNDYVEIWWSTTNQKVTIDCYPPSTGPTRPSTASVVATLSFVSALAA